MTGPDRRDHSTSKPDRRRRPRRPGPGHGTASTFRRTMSEPRDWRAFLADFHARRAGRFEEALERCTADGMTPYTWVIRPVAGRARRVLDLACGSGAAAARLQADEIAAGKPRSAVIGVDRSQEELAVARRRHGLS